MSVGGTVTDAGSGLLLVDKPVGVTSHDVVARVRRALRTRRVGHAGTLDPFATGLLVCAVGHATRLLPYILGEPKVYRTRVRFGTATDTDDVTGTVVAQGASPQWSLLPTAIASLTGTIEQRPPAYSAKHVNGERAYAVARRGDAVTLPPVSIHVYGWHVLAQEPDWLEADVTCSGGTYVRALARDLGTALGTVAHCESLRRVSSGPLHVDAAVPLDAVQRDTPPQPVSPLVALGHLSTQVLTPDECVDVGHGRAVAARVAGDRVVLLANDAADAQIVAIAERAASSAGDRWQPRVVLPPEADA